MRKLTFLFLILSIIACTNGEESILDKQIDLKSGANFRGISAVSDSLCWFSGSEGSVYRVEGNDFSIVNCSPVNYNEYDFRDIYAFSQKKAIVLSAGLPAIMLLTEDGGQSWQEVYRNEKEGIFFDALDFWNNQRGIAFSDAIGTKLPIVETVDGGYTWQAIDSALIPSTADSGQGGFAASGTALKTYGDGQVIIGLGGKEATIYTSNDYGKTWHRQFAPIDQGEASRGVFSFSFIDEKRVLVVGGDYRADSLSNNCISISDNGGYSWKVPNESGITLQGKYLSNVIALDAQEWFAHSRYGAYFTQDGGLTWRDFPFEYYSGSLAENHIWLSGAKGQLTRISIAGLRRSK